MEMTHATKQLATSHAAIQELHVRENSNALVASA
jgi:hypothetical protein